MISPIDTFNLSIAASGLTISLLELMLVVYIPYLDKTTKKFYLFFFTTLFLYVASNLVCQISLLMPEKNFAALSKWSMFFESFFSSCLMIYLTGFMLVKCNESYRCKFFYQICSIWLVYFMLLTVTQFTTFIYYITPDNVYYRGPYYPVLLVPPVLIMLSNLISLIRRKEKLSKRTYRAILCYILIPAMAMIIQMFSFGILIIVIATSISAFIMFGFSLTEAADNYMDQAMKISEQEYTAKTLQIRPHFIYNTLSNIYYLCDNNPQKAKEIVDNFSTYLKKNFSSIAKKEPIPFDEELVHTKAYLEVVKARYGNMLLVDYDIQNSDFKLPPLTLEPMVENAVKHGIDPEADTLHIWINSYEEANDNVIEIENTGSFFPNNEVIDFSSIKTDKEPHVGFENVKSRLQMFCGGSLDIQARNEGGAIVTIKIPKNN